MTKITALGQQSVTQYITMFVMILVTPKAGAKQELLFYNKMMFLGLNQVYH